MCIDNEEMWFWIANGQISSVFFTELSTSNTIMARYYHFTFFFVFYSDKKFFVFFVSSIKMYVVVLI